MRFSGTLFFFPLFEQWGMYLLVVFSLPFFKRDLAYMVGGLASWLYSTTSLIYYCESLGRPPTKISFLQVAWTVGLIFILWKLWLERNYRVFYDTKLASFQLWKMILSRLQKTIFAKCDMSERIEPSHHAIVRNLNLGHNRQRCTLGKRPRHVKQQVC